jgi:hypothetical protein
MKIDPADIVDEFQTGIDLSEEDMYFIISGNYPLNRTSTQVII